MASFNFKFVFSFIILVSFVHFATNKAEDFHYNMGSCSGNRTTPNSPFQLNLRTLFNYLYSNATTGKKEFYNTTVTGRNHSDTVYGVFMCRGDIPSHQLCGQCVSNATQHVISSDFGCSLSMEGDIIYDECMVRYSYNHSSISTVDLTPGYSCETTNASASFKRLLLDTMNKIAEEAANSPIFAKKYATKQERTSGFQTIYSMAQCTPNLSPQDCTRCLNVMIAQLSICNGNEASIYSLSCSVRYAFYPFYRPSQSPAPTGIIPKANTDSKYSQDDLSGYLSHNCSSNKTFTANSAAFLSNLGTLLSSLSSNATIKTGFYTTSVDGINHSDSDTVYGLFMCRGDVSPNLCQLCVQNATERISSECGSSKEAIIWYNHCLLRYSYRPFQTNFRSIENETTPSFQEFSMASASSSRLNQLQQSFFTWTLANTLSDVETATGMGTTKNYGTVTAKLNDNQTLYALAQCTPDLEDCYSCLQNIFIKEIPWCCLASPEGKFFYPSCYMVFGLFKFYGDGNEAADAVSRANPTQGTTEKEKGWSQALLLIVVLVPIAVAVMLFCSGCYFLRRKTRKSYHKTVLKQNFGEKSATLEPLQFDLALIEAATDNFSPENMVGKGGFGEVYKGTLSDGRHIAVKRLSKISKQGLIEFKNEILLIAKFQHRNLVSFIGFCLKDKEKILIYEYVPNGSLDYFLFDTQQQKLLNWSQRYKIIKGIARGIHYLHEHSQPKIIHRDLKPSNVLLDEIMNPKLSDFGIAKIIETDQDQKITNRIVGTFGYMSPEYAMFGHFSEKSDVFSFGVMILEIITGQKNLSSYQPHLIAAGLLSYVWRNWREQTPISILDPKINENYLEIEVIRSIQIGLLCVQEDPNVRPLMVTVVSYLDNHSLELPSPQEPAFFLHRRMDQGIVRRESGFDHSFNNPTPSSINEMSISEFLSR